mmetsp:Transcript_13420/g.40521  ORF Transcript_13420/g.40521 Transcript_13420/m.40521 type:complete len:219 (+) Transcript_13420:1597-2253(+)
MRCAALASSEAASGGLAGSASRTQSRCGGLCARLARRMQKRTVGQELTTGCRGGVSSSVRSTKRAWRTTRCTGSAPVLVAPASGSGERRAESAAPRRGSSTGRLPCAPRTEGSARRSACAQRWRAAGRWWPCAASVADARSGSSASRSASGGLFGAHTVGSWRRCTQSTRCWASTSGRAKPQSASSRRVLPCCAVPISTNCGTATARPASAAARASSA